MMPQIACRPGITGIKVSTNQACPAKTLGCRTPKDMRLLVVDILNGWDGLKKYIYRQVPVLLELI